MNERKIVVVGVVGVAILIGVAVVGAGLLGDRAPTGGASAAPATRPAEGTAAGVPGPALPASAVPPAVLPVEPNPAASAPPHTVVPAAVPLPPGATGAPPWESVDTALRPSGLGVELAAPVSDALDEARARMQHCFEEESARLTRVQPPPPPRSGIYGPAVIVVRLEALQGRLVVEGSELASEGSSSPQLIDCCRRSLRSYEFAAPVAPPQRYKVQMLLQ